jgi:hypothetical protein
MSNYSDTRRQLPVLDDGFQVLDGGFQVFHDEFRVLSDSFRLPDGSFRLPGNVFWVIDDPIIRTEEPEQLT